MILYEIDFDKANQFILKQGLDEIRGVFDH
jgi:hypothetical protein